MRLRQLEVFQAIMTSGSLTEAAKLLNVSQPSISVVLKHAELQLGIQLFKRVAGRVLPTPEAEALFAETQRVFSQLEGLKRVARDIREGRTSYLRLVGNPTLTNTFLSLAVALFHDKRPQVRVILQTENSATRIADGIARGEFDFGFVYGPNSDIYADTETIGHATLACVLRSDHPLARLPRITPSDLGGFGVITYMGGTPIRSMIDRTFAAAQCDLNVTTEIGFSGSAFVLAQQGAGVALVDPVILRTETFPGLVVRPLVGAGSIELQLMYPKTRPRSQISSEFHCILRDVVTEGRMAPAPKATADIVRFIAPA